VRTGLCAGSCWRLLDDGPHNYCRTIAEHAGDATQTVCGILSARARRDADGVAEDLRDHLGGHHADPAAVLVIEQPGDMEKGGPSSVLRR
jgi:hypothetical protein